MYSCSYCCFQNQDEYRFCQNCGHKAKNFAHSHSQTSESEAVEMGKPNSEYEAGADARTQPYQPVLTNNGGQRNKSIMWLIAVVIALALFYFGYRFLFVSPNRMYDFSTADTKYDTLQPGNTTDSYTNTDPAMVTAADSTVSSERNPVAESEPSSNELTTISNLITNYFNFENNEDIGGMEQCLAFPVRRLNDDYAVTKTAFENMYREAFEKSSFHNVEINFEGSSAEKIDGKYYVRIKVVYSYTMPENPDVKNKTDMQLALWINAGFAIEQMYEMKN